MAMYANGNESPTLRTYVSNETKVSFLNVSTFKSAQVPWTYFFLFIAKYVPCLLLFWKTSATEICPKSFRENLRLFFNKEAGI